MSSHKTSYASLNAEDQNKSVTSALSTSVLGAKALLAKYKAAYDEWVKRIITHVLNTPELCDKIREKVISAIHVDNLSQFAEVGHYVIAANSTAFEPSDAQIPLPFSDLPINAILSRIKYDSGGSVDSCMGRRSYSACVINPDLTVAVLLSLESHFLLWKKVVIRVSFK